jgi:hypothetical protein
MERACFSDILGLHEISDNPRRLMLPLDGDFHDSVIGCAHPVKLQRPHQFQTSVRSTAVRPPVIAGAVAIGS